MNWYVEANESGAGASNAALYPTPGLNFFAGPVNGNAVKALYTFNGRTFAVGANLIEIASDGSIIKDFGALPLDASPVTMAANSTNQMIVCAGGQLWLVDLIANTMTQVANDVWGSPLPPMAAVDFVDGYFLALAQNSQNFYISALEGTANPLPGASPVLGGLSWDLGDFGSVSVYADNVLAMLVDHREVWFWGPKRTIVYYNSGDANFPFVPIPSGYIEQGIIAPASPVRLDNSVFWLGADERGGGVGFRSNGYTPMRISNHAVENAWRQYSRIDDCVAYAYQDNGHSFWVIYFPTANVTWVYDATTGLWHERGRWDATTGLYEAHRSRCHVFAYKKHLVGDWKTGRIFQMSTDFLTDNVDTFASPYYIRRFRRAPHIGKELEFEFHHKMRLNIEAGVGTIPPLTGPAHGPPFVLLQDSIGNLWQVSILDNGTATALNLGPGTAPAPPVFLDLGVPGTCYTLGIDTSGNLILI